MFTEHDLVGHAGPAVFARGIPYLQQVRDLEVRDTDATATIVGTGHYLVSLSWQSRSLRGSCTCPHANQGFFCKHNVALGLAVLDEQTVIGSEPAQAPPALDGESLLTNLAYALPRGSVDHYRAPAVAHGLETVLDDAERLSEVDPAADLPVAAAELYRPELDRQLIHTWPDAYVQVVAILTSMRALYAKVGEEDAIDTLIAEIRERYKRRTNLIARLDKANLGRH